MDSTSSAFAVSGALLVGVPLAFLVLYVVWGGLAYAALFDKLGLPSWKGWVPVVREIEVLRIAGQNPWLLLIGLVPIVGGIALVVVLAVAFHRINLGFGYGTGLTVLYVFLPLVAVSVLAWSGARWSAGTVQPAFQAGARHAYGEPAYAPGHAVGGGFPPAWGDVPGPAGSDESVGGQPSPAPAPWAGPVGGGTPVGPVGHTPSPGSDADQGFAPPPYAPVPAAAERYALSTSSYAPAPDPRTPPMPELDAAPAQEPPAPAVPDSPWAPPAPWGSGGSAQPPPTRFEGDGFVPQPPPAQSAFAPVADPYAERMPVPVPDHGGAFGAPVEPFAPAGDLDDHTTISASAVAPEQPDGEVDERTQIATRAVAPRWYLVVGEGGDRHALTSAEVVLGRRPGPEPGLPGVQLLQVYDVTKTISKRHALLRLVDGAWMVTDLASTNGITLVHPDGTEESVPRDVEVALTERFFLGDAELRLENEGSRR